VIAPLRPLYLSAALLFLLPGATVDQVTFHAEEGTSVQRTFDFSLSMELQSMSMTVNDQEVPSDHFDGVEMKITDSQHVVVTDEYGALGDGRPAKLTRSFDELTGKSGESQSGPMGDSDTDQDKSSGLEGTTVVFTWDDEAEAYDAAFQDDGDEDLLADLVEDMDLRGFLPDGDVEEGDAWDADIDAFKRLLEAGGDLDLRTEDEQRSELQDQLSENLEGDVRVTYAGTREEDGVRVAVLKLEVSASTEGSGTQDGPRGETEQTVTMEFDLEGELLWAVEAGHLQSVELSGGLDSVLENHSTFDGGQGPMEAVQTMTFEGEVDFTAAVADA